MRRSTIATCKREIVRRERASGQRNVALRRELNDRILSGGGLEAFFKRLFRPRDGKKVPKGLLYTVTHEWVEEPTNEIEKEEVRCGITDYAQHKMGDILHVELPKVGAWVKAGDPFAQVESAQADGTWETFDIHAPLSGKVAAINERLADNPALLNTDPYGKGWICKLVRIDRLQELLDDPVVMWWANDMMYIKEMDDGTFKPDEELYGMNLLDALEAAKDDLLERYTDDGLEIDLSPDVIEEWERKNKNKDKEAEEWLRRQKEWYETWLRRQKEWLDSTDVEFMGGNCDGWWSDTDREHGCLLGWIDVLEYDGNGKVL